MKRRTLIAAGGASLLAAPSVRAQGGWPAGKAITIVVNFAPGGLTDGIARVFAQHVSQKLGTQILIDNKPGAGGNIGAALVAKAAPDGHTFLHTVSGTLVQNRVLYSKLPFDPDNDFMPVAATSSGELPVVVHKSVPAKNIKELIEYAKTNKVSWGTWAAGSSSHMVCAKLNELYGIKMEVVHYRGEGPMWQDMRAGSLQAAMGSYQALRPLLVDNVIVPIALPTRQRNPKFPDLKTMSEEGFTHNAFTQFGWLGLFAPARTPPDIVKRMSDLWVEAADSEAGKRMYESFGLHEKPMGTAQMAADFELLKSRQIPLLQELGVKLE